MAIFGISSPEIRHSRAAPRAGAPERHCAGGLGT
jgi:hypothetical protein